MTRAHYAISLPLLIGLVGLSQPALAADSQSVLFDHNGSQVRLDVRAGTAIMRYVEPRPGLVAAGVERNTLLFEGRLGPDGSLQGLTYAYASGCAPASYLVNGFWRIDGILLKGAAPRRQRGGCSVVGYDPQSPHALLAFNAIAVLPVNANSVAPAPASVQAIAQGPTPPVPQSSAPLPPPPVRPDSLVSDYDRLMDGYLLSREKLKSDADFAQAFAQFTDCENYSHLRANEFERDRFNKAALSMIQGRGMVSGPLHLRLTAKLGTYDFDKKAFTFRPFAINSVYSVAPPKEYGCGARHVTLPEEFAVRFANFDLVDGIPVAPDVAEKIIKSRTQRPGLRDDNVVIDVDIEFAGRIDDPKDVDTGGLFHMRKRLSSVSATIIDYAVYANAAAPEPFARLSDERKKAYAEDKARIAAEDAADEKANEEFSWSLLAQQFNALKAGPTSADKRTRLAYPGSLVRDAAESDGTRFSVGQLVANYYYEQRNGGYRVGPNLQFINPNPVETIDIPADLAKQVNQNPSAAKLNRLYVPVGIIDDEAAGRSTVMGQIVGLEVEVNQDSRRFRYFVAVPGELKPFVFQRDERSASAFEVVGLKVGMSPEAFTEIATNRFGESSAYDPIRRAFASSGAHCTAAPLTNLDEKPCVTADFDVIGHGWLGGEKIGLTRLTIAQGIRRDQLSSFISDFKQQFGEPRVQKTIGDSTLLTWGAVISKQRDVGSNVQAGWHVVELEVHNTVMGVATRFMLTDPAFLANRAGSSDKPQFSQR